MSARKQLSKAGILKMRMLPLVLLCLTYLLPIDIFAQGVSLIAQAGRSSYGSLYIGPLGGGGGDQSWKPGPIIGIGVRVHTSEHFSVDAVVEYSTHQYDTQKWDP